MAIGVGDRVVQTKELQGCHARTMYGIVEDLAFDKWWNEDSVLVNWEGNIISPSWVRLRHVKLAKRIGTK